MMGTHLGATRRPCPRGSSQLGFRSLQQRKGLIWGSRSEEELQTKPPKSRSSEIKTRREGERRTRHRTRVRAFGPVLRGGGSAPAAARSQRPPEKARLSVGASVFALTEPGRGPCLRTFSAQSSEGKSPQSSRRGPRPPSALRASGPLAPWENCLVEVWPEDSHADPRGGGGGQAWLLGAQDGAVCLLRRALPGVRTVTLQLHSSPARLRAFLPLPTPPDPPVRRSLPGVLGPPHPWGRLAPPHQEVLDCSGREQVWWWPPWEGSHLEPLGPQPPPRGHLKCATRCL